MGNSSKFGTLVAMRPHQLHFDAASAMSVQVGQTVFCLSLQPSSNQGSSTEKPPWGEEEGHLGRPSANQESFSKSSRWANYALNFFKVMKWSLIGCWPLSKKQRGRRLR